MQSSLMRLHNTKFVGYKIELFKWSHKMDLIAMSNDKGEVVVQRLNLQVLWVQPPPSEEARVRGIGWRPDERILAIGYSTGRLDLIDVENHQVLHTLELKSDIECLNWTQNTKESYDDLDELQGNTKLFGNGHKAYLPPLPNFSTLTSHARKVDYNCHTAYATRVFNLLMVALKSGVVKLFVFGMLPCGTISVRSECGVRSHDEFRIQDVKMSSDFHTVFVWVRHKRKLRQLAFENTVFLESSIPLLTLATRYGYIMNTLNYIDEIVQCIIEAWETALLEMDRKMTNYVNSRPDGTVSADFLELLIFGHAPEPLAKFLTRDLTDKGMKKLGNSIEITYSTIQQLVIRPLHTAILNISFHLNYLKGMSKNTYYYKDVLGNISNEASLNAGAFLIKSIELQQVIEQSNRDFKIFWGWLYGVIVRLMEEAVPDEIAAVSQQDVNYLAQFLNTFDDFCEVDSEDRKKRKFNLERVGQYLQNENLQKASRLSVVSDWSGLLKENECLRNSGCIFPHNKEASLVQEHNNLKRSTNKLFDRPNTLISLKFQRKYFLDVCEIDQQTKLEFHSVETEERGTTTFTATVNDQMMNLIQFTPRSEYIKVGRFHFVPPQPKDDHSSASGIGDKLEDQFPQMRLLSSQFYNENILSIVFAYQKNVNITANSFMQMPVETLMPRLILAPIKDRMNVEYSGSSIDLRSLINIELVRSLDICDGSMLVVSGGRKIATIITNTRKKFYHYEMEVEEGDLESDDDEKGNSTKSSEMKDSSRSEDLFNVSENSSS